MPSAAPLRLLSAAVFATLGLFQTPCTEARTWRVAEMNTEQIRQLDPARTVVLMPGGILEEHGPYLPSNTDGYVSERMTRDVAEALTERGRDVLIFPPLVLGAGGANELAAKYPFPGTYTVRLDTLRSVYMDFADQLGEAGFRHVFVINSHGAPNHGRVLAQACEYFNETYGGRMLHVTGGGAVFGSPDNPRNALSERARNEDAWSGHAGIDETSLLLFLRPELVDPGYKNAPAHPATGSNSMIEVAKRDDWAGYFGAPRYADASYGAKLYRLTTAAMIKQALEALDAPAQKTQSQAGPRRAVDDAAVARGRAFEKRQQDWLQKQR